MRERMGWKNLFVLGLVAEKDRYGYELKKLLIDYYLVYGMTVTTIYRSLKLAERQGWVKGQTRSGDKIDQYLYSITEAGKKKLAEEIEFYLGEAEMCLFREFNLALRFRSILSEEKVRAALMRRKHKLTLKINRSFRFLDGADPNPGSSESARHAVDHQINERAWIDRYLAATDPREELETVENF